MAFLPEPATILSKDRELVDYQRQTGRDSTEATRETHRPFGSGRKAAPLEAEQTCPMKMQIILATSRNQPALTSSDSILRDELEKRGAQVRAMPWDNILPGGEDECLVCLRSTWDYSLRAD